MKPEDWKDILDRIRKQAEQYRKEDTGDQSKWSIYNQGRADALERLLGELTKIK